MCISTTIIVFISFFLTFKFLLLIILGGQQECTWICVPNGQQITTDSAPVTTAAGSTFPPRFNSTAAGASNNSGKLQYSHIGLAFLTFIVITIVH
ncbi:hypothetical protein PPL_09922 [Heterostelium album PN500]|uniref:Uncharacterized protein n=1 Tax=Heterostelium pallidum (strain ATCC 26659 / Pp 5 / PN500) TaxID=670386 RepID=D3BPQ5_HETP5|nr:hypothetical protein PPL_09922 [Heterostelium album PN500]EFA76617.1 hypothetical protein PPL_09922 [Heterostelium album PN500]|eukprot:XP_020428749.1 hypothetical protein PPL_09922 [Heterostelium album PN500]